ncbi:acyl-CoA dehydrogenase [Streptomyces griseus]|uniref:acyl-CoA dehydrogenase n=1 Tax=Streptomyces griseus TaxID=1911 RepID=UPI0006906850|nr:acyl-CoA dehydrogenase [Streptomyces griseus]
MDLHQDPIQSQIADAVALALTHTGEVRRELAAVGVPTLGLPTSLGGMGLGLTADVAVHRELGRGLETAPELRETVLCLELLADAGVDGLGDVLARVHEGTGTAVSIGLHGPTSIRLDGDGLLWGTSEALPAAGWDVALVRAATDGGGHRWLLVRPDGATVRREEVTLLGTPAARWRFEAAAGQPVPVVEAQRRRAVAAARVRQAALLLGIAGRALDTARAHVGRRLQFGKPLLEFQTVSHRITTLIGEADGWELLLAEAAWAHDQGAEAPATAPQVLAAAAEHALKAARLSLQLHGVRGMLAHSVPATAYRLATVEAVRLGPPAGLWLEAGRARLAGTRA